MMMNKGTNTFNQSFGSKLTSFHLTNTHLVKQIKFIL